MSEANLTKLTLERWAALDAAASPGPWSAKSRDCDGLDNPTLGWDIEGAPISDLERGQFRNGADAKLCAASRGAPTRLLAALRGLRADWAAYRQRLDAIGNHGQAIVLEGCQQELGHLIETLDLAAPPQENA